MLSPIIPHDIHQMGAAPVDFGADSNLYVEFQRVAEFNRHKSEQEGMPIYDAVDVVVVRQPGERDAPAVRATEWHKRRFPAQWEAYQASQQQRQVGMPLEYLFAEAPDVIKMLRSRSIHSIEALANLSETGMNGLGHGARALVNKAKEFLDGMRGAAGVRRLQSQITNRDDQIETLTARVNELTAILSHIETKKEMT